MGRPSAFLFHSNLKISISHYQIDSMASTAYIKNIPFKGQKYPDLHNIYCLY